MRKKSGEAALVRETADSGDDDHISDWFPDCEGLHRSAACIAGLRESASSSSPSLYLTQSLQENFDRSQWYPSVPRNSSGPGCSGSEPRTAASGPLLCTRSHPAALSPRHPPFLTVLGETKMSARPQRGLVSAKCCLAVLQPSLKHSF